MDARAYTRHDLVREYAVRFNVHKRTADRNYRWLLQSATIPYHIADEIAVLIGWHPAAVYGQEWEQIGEALDAE